MEINRKKKGSITVEASLAVPLFFLVVFSLMYLLEILGEQMQVQQKLLVAVRTYETYETRQPYITTNADAIWKLQWEMDDEGEYGICKCVWGRQIPMLGKWFLITNHQRLPVRKYSGLSMVPKETQTDEGYVYIAENGTVYHREVSCTYLHLGIRQIAADSLETERNRSGGIYKPCESCMKRGRAVAGQTVYITPYGDRYHRTKDCSGLRRTVRKVKKSQVGNLPPCSKCGIKE